MKAVQSPNPPYIKQAFPIKASTSWPIVIRDGIACGLMIISGRMPSLLNGISDSGTSKPTVPFCPHLLQNLSPMLGIRSCLHLTLAILNPCSPSVIKALSTNPS